MSLAATVSWQYLDGALWGFGENVAKLGTTLYLAIVLTTPFLPEKM